jgi:myo-inositol-1(or 4)-monophosphatase
VAELDIAEVCAWAREGGEIARRYFQTSLEQHRKADNSFVTQADLEIEQLVRDYIQKRHPDHGIMGEEQGIGTIDCEYVWSLDPLDGTDAFVAGLPVWAVSIGLLRHGKPYLGAIYLPLSDECYWNDLSGRAYCNNERITVSAADTFDTQDAIMVTSRAHIDYDMGFPGKARSLGSFAAHCCYVARGSVVGALLGYPQIWDIAAGIAILQAAGGVAVTLAGEPLDMRPMLQGQTPSAPLFISSPALCDELRGYIRERHRT